MSAVRILFDMSGDFFNYDRSVLTEILLVPRHVPLESSMHGAFLTPGEAWVGTSAVSHISPSRMFIVFPSYVIVIVRSPFCFTLEPKEPRSGVSLLPFCFIQ